MNLISAVVCLLGIGTIYGQDQVAIAPRVRRAAAEDNASIRVNVNEVLIPVTVTDSFGATVRGLGKEAFHVYEEDGTEREPCSLLGNDGPVSIGIIFDGSSSMKKKLDDGLAAVNQLFLTSDDEDEYFLIQFADRIEITSGFTRDAEDIKSWLKPVRPHGWTALYDAVYLGFNSMKHAKNPRKALVVFTDGEDNHSRYTRSEVLGMAKEMGASVFTIGMVHGDNFLRELGYETGGEQVVVKDLTELSPAVWKLSEVMRHQYLVGYCVPTQDGRYHKLRIAVTPPPGVPRFTVSARQGYYSIESFGK